MPSLRARFYLTLAAAIITMPFVVIGDMNRPWHLPILFGWVVVFGGYGLLLRCPQCKKPIGQNKYGFHRPWADRICSRCGLNLVGK